MSVSAEQTLRLRVKNLDAMPVILGPLIQCLDVPTDEIKIEKIIELVSYDKAIAAQCLRMANSALFSRRTPVDSIRGAVMALGVSRLRDILWASFLARMA